MKNIILSASFLIVALSSCDKTYKCECVASSTTGAGTASTNPTNLPGEFKSNESGATAICTEVGTQATANGAKGVTVTCNAVIVK
jgi:hypothetical protein